VLREDQFKGKQYFMRIFYKILSYLSLGDNAKQLSKSNSLR